VIVDAHQHYWEVARGDYRWLGPHLAPLYRDFGPQDLEPELAACGVAGTILVQAADSLAETRYLLALAARTDAVLGVVGWVDLEAPSARAEIAELARDPLLVGIRPMLQDLADPRWVLREEVVRALGELPRHGLCFDALVRPVQLDAIAELGTRIPELDLVVDHGGKPTLGARRWSGFAQWRAAHARIAANPRARCKLSGLVTEVEPGLSLALARSELARTLDVLLDLYGPTRCLWGSDWPVVTLRCGYREWWTLAHELTARLSESEQALVFGVNASTFYRRARSPRARTLARPGLA